MTRHVYMCHSCKATVLLYVGDCNTPKPFRDTYPHALRTSLSRCDGDLEPSPNHIQAAYLLGGPAAVKAVLGAEWLVLGHNQEAVE